jgi:glycosyltransferase involved in cell wall biosynthesis
MQKPWLSILIPVYNVAEYLEECVQSIFSQIPDSGVEVILLDDCSTDISLQICNELVERHAPKIRLLRHESNAGLSAARNSLLRCATGEYIWFVDSDDTLLPNAIASLRKIVHRHGPDLVMCDYRKGRSRRSSFRGPGRSLQRDPNRLIAGVFKSRKMYSWIKIARRSLWSQDLRFPEGKYFEDQYTTPWLLLRAKSYYYEPSAWVRYRIRAGSIMASVNREKGRFDHRKHRDMALALAGYGTALRDLPFGRDRLLHFWVSHFTATEFRKLGSKLLGAEPGRVGFQALADYHAMMEPCAPLTFSQMEREYLRRLKLYDWFWLRHYRRIALKVYETEVVGQVALENG